MYATAQVSANLQSWPQSRLPSPAQCKSPLAWASSLGSSHGRWTRGGRLESHRLDFCSDSQLSHKVRTSGLICKGSKNKEEKKEEKKKEKKKEEKNKVDFSRDVLTPSQREKWEEASKLLEALGFTTKEADKMLGKAFGWVKSKYWSESHEQTLPELEKVTSKIDFVKALGLSDVELTPVLKKFPELLDCRETLMTHNLGILDKEWGIKGNLLKSLLKRNPNVLGYSVDCKGDCMAQCTRCWVRL